MLRRDFLSTVAPVGLGPHLAAQIAPETARKAVGDRMAIMIDVNQAQSSGDWQPGILWDFRRAVETACELQRLSCYWLEEPLPRYAFDKLAELNRLVELPIAGGENNHGIHEFLRMLRVDVYDIVQPESMVMEGVVTALRKIDALAQAFVPYHGGGDLGTIAHLHLVASWPYAPVFELLHDPPIGSYRHRFSLMQNPLVDKGGYLPVPQAPGPGVEVNRNLLNV